MSQLFKFLIKCWSIVPFYIVASATPIAETLTVKTASLANLAIYPEHSAPAEVVSLNKSTVSAEIEAAVNEFLVEVGDSVEAGAILARLECVRYELSQRRGVADLEALKQQRVLAKQRLQRTRQLILKKSIAPELLDEREAEYAVLNAEIQAMTADIAIRKLDVSKCTVVSPFRALVVERISAVGEFVKKGTALVKLVDLDTIELSAQVPAGDVPTPKTASALWFDYDGRRYAVAPRVIVPMINTETGNREMRLAFTETTPLPGTFGRLVWHDMQAHLPAALIVKRGGVAGVFTVADGRAVFHPLPNAGGGRANAATLNDTDAIVVEGHFALKHDMPVTTFNN